VFRHASEFRVRLDETDAMGVAFHGSYFSWFDAARMDYVRALGLMPRLLAGGLANLVVRAEADFRAPARLEDLVVVRARIERIGRSSFAFRFRVERKPDGTLLAEGGSVHAMIDPATRAPVPVPDDVRAAVRAFEGSALSES
jgi:acyl-CoA thioester hydrolase